MPDNPLLHLEDDSEQQPVLDRGAVEFIRDKVDKIYDEEPDAYEEMEEVTVTPNRSRHQRYMYKLATSGKDIATIQTEWHEYYESLSDEDKKKVWQEFYDSQKLLTKQPFTSGEPSMAKVLSEHKNQLSAPKRGRPAGSHNKKTKDFQAIVEEHVKTRGKLTAKQHLQSLIFGLSMGFIVIFIFLFGFFNELFIAPFIQPSRNNPSTPIILTDNGVSPTPNPEVIIPKINVEIPVNYSVTSTDENVIESDLEDGVVHFPTTVDPGQDGNAAFFGHSSNNIFNSGKYKFAFVLLHNLVNGDNFYLTFNDKLYVYQVISKTVVSPSDVAVLGPVAGQTATATLITCDPPGTSINRLIVVGKQISPSTTGDTQATINTASAVSASATLPGNGPTLWTKFISTITGKSVSVIIVVIATAVFLFRLNKRFKEN